MEKKNLLEVIETDNEDETCRTFVLHGEDHTLGNSLRYIIMKNPDVQFCGYSIPHPSENKINFRIQTNGAIATEILKKGLTDLYHACDHVLKTFEVGIENFKKRRFPPDYEMASADT
ncbi:DNA-directed RNA polymerases I and III subunit RPAC2-like [Ylistrum balloti]|uniref:DNA-directed RNA polymerases I and III subunit RPAC2-like n=1 Tax=Ylistrum balloti TaxID=509963 RepID=UPI002905F071|nr:DNA-directed RNA polymerases I and III subunit RPAC2-like [Ylistrum balloti]